MTAERTCSKHAWLVQEVHLRLAGCDQGRRRVCSTGCFVCVRDSSELVHAIIIIIIIATAQRHSLPCALRICVREGLTQPHAAAAAAALEDSPVASLMLCLRNRPSPGAVNGLTTPFDGLRTSVRELNARAGMHLMRPWALSREPAVNQLQC